MSMAEGGYISSATDFLNTCQLGGQEGTATPFWDKPSLISRVCGSSLILLAEFQLC
jgi:hypothetical protein